VTILLAAATLPAMVNCTTTSADGSADRDWPIGTPDTMWQDRNLPGSYRHLDEILPTRTIRAADDPLRLKNGDPVGPIEYRFDGEARSLDDYADAARMTGLIAVRNGEVRFERYSRGATADSRLTGMSITKSVVSTLVGMALHEGLIDDLSDPIDRYVPALAGNGHAGVTIEAVLQMSSGIDFTEAYGDPGSDSARLWDAVADPRSTPVTDILLARGSQAPPDTRFNYNPLDTQALGWLVRSVTGDDLSTYLTESIWRPAGMRGDATWVLDGAGNTANEVAYCCLNARLRDWARFGMLFAQDGGINGTRLLPASWIERATEPNRTGRILCRVNSMTTIHSAISITGGRSRNRNRLSSHWASTVSSSTWIPRRTSSSYRPRPGETTGILNSNASSTRSRNASGN
jgi:CubicO group peptidase (beta-lactamase class C family)